MKGNLEIGGVEEPEEQFDYERLLAKCLSHWKWFVLSGVLCLALSVYLAFSQTPLYLVHTKLLINDPSQGMGGKMQLLEGLGLSGVGGPVDDEAEVLRSQDLLQKVIEDMKLNVVCYEQGRLRNKELYRSPFQVELMQPADTIEAEPYTLEFVDIQKIRIEGAEIDTVLGFESPLYIEEMGEIRIHKTENEPEPGKRYAFQVSSVQQTLERLSEQMTVEITGKKASVIEITLKYPRREKGADILNRFLDTYTQENLNDKNRVADSTYAFIQNRLQYLGSELGTLERNIQKFRQQNNVTEMSEQARLMLSNTSEYVNELAKIETQISVLESLSDYLKDNGKNARAVPSSLVVADPLFGALVENYNSLVMDRDRMLISATRTNPDVVNLDKQIGKLRNDMLVNLEVSKKTLEITKNDLERRISRIENQAQDVPAKERNFLDLARQQKIKEELFMFLMQKSEETAISKTNNTPNTKNIDVPKSDSQPVSPKKKIYIAMGFLVGLLIPAGVIYSKMMLNTRVDSKEDITQRTIVPVIGEISHNKDADNLIVVKKGRSAISEQFRALRTNLSFYLRRKDEKVILMTSSVSGEGKSFTAINLGSVVALTGKKVLLMELDLRKPGLSKKLGIVNDIGFSNYIIDEDIYPNEIIKKVPAQENLFLITSGLLPPNPAEILMSPRAAALLKELKSSFDLIIMDAPPVGLVTDAQLLGDLADFCIYMVRQHVTLKSQLGIVEDLRVNHKMKNIGIVVNDILAEQGSGYGYGSSYGTYGNEVENDKAWFKFLRRTTQREKV